MTVDNHELSEYDRFLLDALLQQAAKEAEKPLSSATRRALTKSFLEEHQQVKRGQINAKGQDTRSRKKRGLQAQEAPRFSVAAPSGKAQTRALMTT